MNELAVLMRRDLRQFSESALSYLRREQILYCASMRASACKMVPLFVLAFFAGVALALRSLSLFSESPWQVAIATLALVSPISVTGGVMLVMASSSNTRWTTCIVTDAALAAYRALLVKEALGNTPQGVRPFHAAEVKQVQALEGLARTLEDFAVRRARPDGMRPAPDVVKRFSAMAMMIRRLRDDVQLGGEGGRTRALQEVHRFIEQFTRRRYRAIARNYSGSTELVDLRRRRRDSKIHVGGHVVITLSLLVGAYAMTRTADSVIVAAVCVAVFEAWLQLLRARRNSLAAHDGSSSA